MSEDAAILCPSYRCEENATLLGIVQDDGRVALAIERIVIDRRFVEIARSGREPERRFRFAGKCAQAACCHWSGSRCRVIDRTLAILGPRSTADGLPECPIRPDCRWYLQAGADACSACPEVITHRLAAEVEGSKVAVPIIALGTERLSLRIPVLK